MLLAGLAIATSASARVYLTRDEALARVFGPNAEVTRESVFLTDEQVAAARERVGDGIEIRSALVTRYVVASDGVQAGTAYVDTHRVRTLPQTVLVAVTPDGEVRSVEILSFDEPADYLPRDGWLEQFDGRELERDLAVKRGIDGITGATITAHAVTDAVRRVLALHGVIRDAERDGEPGETRP